MDREIALLLRILDQAYDHRAWHGTNLRGSLRGLSLEEAAWRPQPSRHNIWEIMVHAAYWKYAVQRRLTGGKRGSFALKGSNWFPRSENQSKELWLQDLRLLEEAHKSLRVAISRLTPRDLSRTAPGGSTKVEALVYGVACHDVYHAGQIQLLKRMQ
jgi:uncharacterized damage-inducible protein DinB